MYTVLGFVAVAGVGGVLVSQARLYSVQREIIDARESLRGAVAVLVEEVQGASASRLDLSGLGPNSLTLRSTQGAGIVCSKHPSAPRYGLKEVRGSFAATASDSSLVYDVSGNRWLALKVNQVMTDYQEAGVPPCAWAGSAAPDLVVELLGVIPEIEVGSPVRVFRRVDYGLFPQGDRWWLGRRTGGESAYDLITGPLRSPTEDGLSLAYLDEDGLVTTDSSRVRQVLIEVRAESFEQVLTSGGPKYRQDSVKVSAFLRN
jgi:hypothetical protein